MNLKNFYLKDRLHTAPSARFASSNKFTISKKLYYNNICIQILTTSEYHANLEITLIRILSRKYPRGFGDWEAIDGERRKVFT